jgi:hypothetical protein
MQSYFPEAVAVLLTKIENYGLSNIHVVPREMEFAAGEGELRARREGN